MTTANTPKGAATRRRILDAAWELSDARGAEVVLGGVTLREIASAVGMSPSAISYHFQSLEALAVAMVEQLAADLSPLLVGAVDEMLDGVLDTGLAGAARAAAEANWALLTSPSEVNFERRLLRAYAAAGHDDAVRAATSTLQEGWVDDLALVYRRTAERLGLRTVEPFDVREVALAIASLADGLLHHWMSDPATVRPALMADIVVALASATIVPVARHVDLAELSAVLSTGTGWHEALHDDIELAAPAAPLFSSGVGSVTLTEAARVLGMGTEQAARRFGTVERVAALSFGRHLPAVARAAGRRTHAGAAVCLTDGVYELARVAIADPHCALALLQQRQLARLDADADDRGWTPIVPFESALEVPLHDLLEGDAARSSDLCPLVVDTVLGMSASRRRVAPGSVAECALRLVPVDF